MFPCCLASCSQTHRLAFGDRISCVAEGDHNGMAGISESHWISGDTVSRPVQYANLVLGQMKPYKWEVFGVLCDWSSWWKLEGHDNWDPVCMLKHEGKKLVKLRKAWVTIWRGRLACVRREGMGSDCDYTGRRMVIRGKGPLITDVLGDIARKHRDLTTISPEDGILEFEIQRKQV